jgi:hypothetical protein
MEARLILDSGLFLPANPGCIEIGFFQNAVGPDIRVYFDGQESQLPIPSKLIANGRRIEVILRGVDGSAVQQPTSRSATLSNQLAQLNDLYDSNIAVDRSRFDWILCLYSCRLRGSIIKKRVFIETRKNGDGSFTTTGRSKLITEVSHNVVASFDLSKGEHLELRANGKVFLSSAMVDFANAFQIEFASDDSAGKRLYSYPLVVPRQLYWFPDGCDEGPSGPYPPCQIA